MEVTKSGESIFSDPEAVHSAQKVLWDSYCDVTEELRKVVASFPANNDQGNTLIDLSAKHSAIKNDLSRVIDEWQLFTTQLVKDIDSLSKDNKELQHKLSQDVNRIHSQAAEVLQNVLHQKVDAENDRENAQCEATAAKARVAELEGKVKALQAEVVSVKDKARDDADKMNSELLKQTAEASRAVSNFWNETSAHEKTKDELTRVIESLKKEKETAADRTDQLASELWRAQQERDNIKMQFAQLEFEMSAVNTRAAKLEEIVGELRHASEKAAENNQELRTLAELNQLMEKELSQHRQTEAELKKLLEHQEQELIHKSESVNVNRTALTDVMNEYEQAKVEFANRNAELAREIAELKERTSASTSSAAIERDEYKNLLMESKSQNEELRDKLASAEDKMQEFQNLLGKQTARCAELAQTCTSQGEREADLEKRLSSAREKCIQKDNEAYDRLLATEKRIRILEEELEKRKAITSSTVVPLVDHEAAVMALESQYLSATKERDQVQERLDLLREEMKRYTNPEAANTNEEPTVSLAYHASEIQALTVQMREQEALHDMVTEDLSRRIKELEKKRALEEPGEPVDEEKESLLCHISSLVLENRALKQQSTRFKRDLPLSPLASRTEALEGMNDLETRIHQLEQEEWSSYNKSPRSAHHLRRFEDRLEHLEANKHLISTGGSPWREVSIRALDERVKQLEEDASHVRRQLFKDPSDVSEANTSQVAVKSDTNNSIDTSLKEEEALRLELSSVKTELVVAQGELTETRRRLHEQRQVNVSLVHSAEPAKKSARPQPSTIRVTQEILEKNRHLEDRIASLEDEKRKVEAEKRVLQVENRRLNQDKRKDRKEKEALLKQTKSEEVDRDLLEQKDKLAIQNDSFKTENQRLVDRIQWLEGLVFDKEATDPKLLKMSHEVESLKRQLRQAKLDLEMSEKTLENARNTANHRHEPHTEMMQKLQFVIEEKDVHINVLQSQLRETREELSKAHDELRVLMRTNSSLSKREVDFEERADALNWLVNSRGRLVRDLVAAHGKAERLLQLIGQVDTSLAALRGMQKSPLFKSCKVSTRHCALAIEDAEAAVRRVMALHLTLSEKRENGVEAAMFQVDSAGNLLAHTPARVFTDPITKAQAPKDVESPGEAIISYSSPSRGASTSRSMTPPGADRSIPYRTGYGFASPTSSPALGSPYLGSRLYSEAPRNVSPYRGSPALPVATHSVPVHLGTYGAGTSQSTPKARSGSNNRVPNPKRTPEPAPISPRLNTRDRTPLCSPRQH